MNFNNAGLVWQARTGSFSGTETQLLTAREIAGTTEGNRVYGFKITRTGNTYLGFGFIVRGNGTVETASASLNIPADQTPERFKIGGLDSASERPNGNFFGPQLSWDRTIKNIIVRKTTTPPTNAVFQTQTPEDYYTP